MRTDVLPEELLVVDDEAFTSGSGCLRRQHVRLRNVPHVDPGVADRCEFLVIVDVLIEHVVELPDGLVELVEARYLVDGRLPNAS